MKEIPSLVGLRCFDAVARCGSVTKAAAALNVTHSAVSQQIKRLELMLGSSLFIRDRRVIKLSESGVSYLISVRHALGIIAVATLEFQSASREAECHPRDGE